MTQRNARRNYAAMLTLPALLLTGCATGLHNSAPASPQLPSPPALSQPIPQRSYSESAQANIEAWQKRLTASFPTGKP